MKKRIVFCLLGLGFCFGLGGFPFGCTGSDDSGDRPEADQVTSTEGCQVDNSSPRPNKAPEWQLKPNETTGSGYICPVRDKDTFWFHIDRPNTIVNIRLKNNTPSSPVDYCYALYPDGDPKVVKMLDQECDPDGMDGYTQVEARHYLSDAGDYFIEVTDFTSDDQDSRNGYQISLQTQVDPDTNETNNTAATATVLVSGAQKEGFLSFKGDKDYFKITTTQSDQVAKIQLSMAKGTPVDLMYTFFDAAGAKVNEAKNGSGLTKAAAFADALPMPSPGTYTLVVQDEGDDDSDIAIGYKITVTAVAEPDSRDRGARNDKIENATVFSSGAQLSAYIGTRGDTDWYKITAPGVTNMAPGLLEVDLIVDNASDMQLAARLVLGDIATPCVAGDRCDMLKTSCNQKGQCPKKKEFGDKPDPACLNFTCASQVCLPPTNTGYFCAGASVCLPEGFCGYSPVLIEGADWSIDPIPNLRHLHSVIPMFEGTYYLGVYDNRKPSSGFDLDRSYKLTLTLREEKDKNEAPANGVFFPTIDNEGEAFSKAWNAWLASPVSCIENSTTGDFTCDITGYLSYRGDQDWYKLENFLRPGVDYDLEVVWNYTPSSTFPTCPNGNPTADDLCWSLNYAIYSVGFPAGRPPTLSGFSSNIFTPGSGSYDGDFARDPAKKMEPAQCFYICSLQPEHQSLLTTAYFSIQQFNRKAFDANQPYQFTIRATKGCPSDCGNCTKGPRPLPTDPIPTSFCWDCYCGADAPAKCWERPLNCR